MKLGSRVIARTLGYYLRHVSAHPGRWRLESTAIRRSGALTGRLRPAIIKTSHGFRMRVDGNSQAGRVLYVTGRYEPDVTAEIKRFAGPGDLVIDGGAHIGFFTLLASCCVGPTGRVMAFEPSSTTAEILRANVQLNGRTNITIVEAALSDASGTGVLAQKSATERSYGRKIRELRYAITLEEKYSKDEILGRYLNIAYFGAGAYGVEAAARHYFNIPAKKLNLALFKTAQLHMRFGAVLAVGLGVNWLITSL